MAITITALMQFCLPPECGEVSLGVTVLLAQTVFLLIVTDTLPPKSDTVSIAGKIEFINLHLVENSITLVRVGTVASKRH